MKLAALLFQPQNLADTVMLATLHNAITCGVIPLGVG